MKPCFAALLLATLVGCSDGPSTSTVTGQVSYKGQPLPSGSVSFYPAEGRPVATKLDANGGYSAALPPGDYTVTVIVTPSLPPDWKEGDPVPKAPVKIPPQYGSRVRSPLTASVAADQTEPVDLELR